MKKIETTAAPSSKGVYSQGVVTNSAQQLLFVSGQLPIDPTTDHLVTSNIADQTKQVLDNITAILNAAGSSWQQVVKVEIFLTDLNAHFSLVNEIYRTYINPSLPPARQTIQVGALPRGAPIEISCIAIV